MSILKEKSISSRHVARGRNSNVEAMRLLAMLLITFNHGPWSALGYINPEWSYVHRLSLSIIVACLVNWGGVGDVLFFLISAWFLCDEQQSVRKNISRCWKLEKQLWFYSILLYIALLVVWYKQGNLSMKQVARQGFNALFPCATGLWWYTTSYVLFLLICPLLTRGLRQLSFKAHASLFVALILIYGFTPNAIFPLNNTYTFVLFVYLYILMTFLRWRVPQVCANKSFAKKLIYIGLIFGLGSQTIVQCFSPSKTYNMTPLWLNSPRCLPSMCIGFGLLVLAFSAKKHYNKIVNRFAASTLSIYLVGASPFVLLNQSSIAERIPLLGGIGAIAILSGLLLCLYICVLLFDLVRQYIYTITVDRNNSEQASWICKNLLSLRETIWDFGKKLITE